MPRRTPRSSASGCCFRRCRRPISTLRSPRSALNQPAQAADAIAHFLAHNPGDPRGELLQGQIQLNLKQYDAAIGTLRALAGAGKADATAYDLLGRAYALSGRMREASEALQRAAQLSPQDAGILDRLAAAEARSGNAGEAENVLQHALALAPKAAGTGAALVIAAIDAGDYARAQTALDAFRQQQGDSETADNLAGLLKLSQFDLAGARAAFEAMLVQHPNSVVARLNLARVAGLSGDVAGQRAAYEAMLAKDPGNLAALTAIVPLLLDAGDAATARRLAEAAHAAHPDDLEPTLVLVQIDARAGDPDAALGRIAQALHQQPENLTLLQLQAQVQAGANRQSAAEATDRQILTIDPKQLQARQALVAMLVRAKDFDAARAAIREGLTAMPGNPELMNARVQTEVASGDLPAALAAADGLANDPMNLPAARMLRGNAYLGANRPADAAAAYLAALKTAPSLQLALAAAAALETAGQPVQAHQVVQDWVEKHPNDATAKAVLAGIEIRQNQLDAAGRDLEAALAIRPDDPGALNNLAWVDQQRGNPQAATIARRAFFLAPSPATADTLGWILATGSDPRGALPLLRQAAAAAPSDPRIRYHLAYALRLDGQKDAAIALLKVLAADKAGFDGQADARKMLSDMTAQN